MPELKYDLHIHSTASDGKLSPTAVIEHAASRGLDTIALTDHDSIDGVMEASHAAANREMTLISGAEISCTWHGITIHVLALGIQCVDALDNLLQRLQAIRQQRGKQMGQKLEQAGITNALAGTQALVGSGCVTRTHYARYLYEHGHVKTMQDAFRKYLLRGKPGYVNVTWAGLDEAVSAIHDSGGLAAIAHPNRYPLTNSKCERLLSEFCACGGDGLEVVAPSMRPEETLRYAKLARQFGLLASRGSDFHDPDGYHDMGRIAPIPDICPPIIEHL
jgi:3',5'-nucleoside bisphosphate phosphatase